MKTLEVKVGNVIIGGDHPIVVQTMCNTHTSDVEASAAQCRRLAAAGAQLIRLTVPSLAQVESLKEIKKRWTLDAQSGRLHCENKRLFAIPDIYACCEFWFLHDENPKGLLKNGEVACRIYRMYDKVDCLRSPH